MNVSIAVDIGGTQMRAACYPPDSPSLKSLARVSTAHSYLTPLERLYELIASIWPEDDTVTSIGVAAPGPVDPYQGIIRAAPNIPGWINLPLRSLLEERFKVPVSLGNDANLAALGERMFGAGQGHHHLIYMTVSTGIGGGIIIDDRLLLGARGLAAEIGHITVLPGGPLCGCGQLGHLEAVASGTAIARWTEQELARGAASILPAGGTITTREVAAAAQNGDELAITAFERAGAFIGQTLASFLHIFNPTAIIIGGGVSRSGPLLMEPMKTAMREHVLSPHYLEGMTLTTGALGDEVGLMGALALARQAQSQTADRR